MNAFLEISWLASTILTRLLDSCDLSQLEPWQKNGVLSLIMPRTAYDKARTDNISKATKVWTIFVVLSPRRNICSMYFRVFRTEQQGILVTTTNVERTFQENLMKRKARGRQN
jgi:hypothetical protein